MSPSWQTIGWIEVDSGACSFGAEADLGSDFHLSLDQVPASERGARAIDLTPEGLPLIVCQTREDNWFPIEIQHRDGGVAAARMNFTTDVDELEGAWTTVGRLDLARRSCIAADPFCPPSDDYRFSFEVKTGTYVAQIFEYVYEDGAEDCLGLRIVHEEYVTDLPPADDPVLSS